MSVPLIHTAIAGAPSPAEGEGDGAPIFPWWSFTKTVLATAALMLAERGRLELDEELPTRRFTLRQLLQHRAGVPNYGRLAAYHDAVASGDDPWPVADLLERVDADRPDFAPDEGWAYSNVGYLYVRQLVERTMDLDLRDALAGLIFTPLDLSSARVATLPADLDDTVYGNERGYHPGWVYHGLAIGSASDAVRLLEALMTGRLLSPGFLALMTTAYPLGGPLLNRPWTKTGYGLGLMIGRMAKGGRAIGHSGVGPWDVCAVYHFPDKNPPRTAAAFTRGHDEGIAEFAVERLAAD